MTAGMPHVTPEEVDDLVSAAREAARARVHAELVEHFVADYRRELSRRTGGDGCQAAYDARRAPSPAPPADAPDPPRAEPAPQRRPPEAQQAAGPVPRIPERHPAGMPDFQLAAEPVLEVPEWRPAGGPAPDDEAWPKPATCSERVWYLYGLVRAEEADRLTALEGIDGTPVRVVAEGPVAAVAGELELAPFQAAQTATDLSEDGWLARALRAHDRLGAEAYASVPLLPLRFGCLYPERAAVVDMLRSRRESILAELDRLAGAGEWSVKAFAAPPTTSGDGPPGPGGDPADGTAWMNRQLDVAVSRDRLQRRRETLVGDLDERLSGHALDRYARDAVGRDGQRSLFNVVYLVDGAAGDGFRAALRDARRDCGDELRLVVHGPAPAYHFVRWEAPHG